MQFQNDTLIITANGIYLYEVKNVEVPAERVHAIIEENKKTALLFGLKTEEKSLFLCSFFLLFVEIDRQSNSGQENAESRVDRLRQQCIHHDETASNDCD